MAPGVLNLEKSAPSGRFSGKSIIFNKEIAAYKTLLCYVGKKPLTPNRCYLREHFTTLYEKKYFFLNIH